uniref:E2 ubiquitin-conjugating enzyme n=1 Tax=Steinernema glaseri TaxID=37863 RepID=A0A1I8A965_9BILA
MANLSYARLQRECKECITNAELLGSGISIEMLDESFTKLKGQIRGPSDCPYENGEFQLDIEIPKDYPFSPPKVKFITRLWHPNISSQTGTICLDILKDKWTASLSIRTILLSIQALLNLPEPKDPQDAVVAKQFMENRDMFNATAKFWTQFYAKAPGEKDADMLGKIQKLVTLGVSTEKALSTLSCNSWDLEKATHYIFD